MPRRRTERGLENNKVLKQATYFALNGLWLILCGVPGTLAAFAITSGLGLVGTWRVVVTAPIAMVFTVGLFVLSVAVARALHLTR